MMLDFLNASHLLQKYGLKIAPFVTEKEKVIAFAEKYGWPIVLKVYSRHAIHKIEQGLVKIVGEDEWEKVWDEMGEKVSGWEDAIIIAQKMEKGREVIIGGKRDEQFGPVVLFGLGGIFVEVLKDVSLRVAPIDKEEALEMIKEIKGYPILAGVRGKKAVNFDALADGIVRVSQLMDKENIKELDLNPCFIEKELVVADVRMIFD